MMRFGQYSALSMHSATRPTPCKQADVAAGVTSEARSLSSQGGRGACRYTPHASRPDDVNRCVHWNVRNRFVVAFILVAVVPLVVFGALVYSRTANALREVEQDQIAAQTTGARQVLRQRVRDQRAFIHDYAVWDEFHRPSGRTAELWIRNNVTGLGARQQRDQPGDPVCDRRARRSRAAVTASRTPLWASEARAGRAPRRDRRRPRGRWTGRLYVLAAAPIVAQTYPSRPAGVLVFGQAVSDAVLERRQPVHRRPGPARRLHRQRRLGGDRTQRERRPSRPSARRRT